MLGIDKWVVDGFSALRGQSIALVCNQASIASDFVHVLDHLLPHHKAGKLKVGAVMGPQHGIWGHTQDNMIEWEGYEDPRTGLRFFSLYGERREPAEAWLEGVDRLVFDVPDVGARYYTFIWTLALCMKVCERLGIPVTVLDRPNPISGEQVEGGVLDPQFASFVGLHPLPIRHGLTVGEIARYLKSSFYPKADLDVVTVDGWKRGQYLDETAFPWAMPSPNMPTVDTAVVYPGMCLLEGTKLSEGRGTTRPFETFGAPYIDGWQLCKSLNGQGLQGVVFRPVQFEPTFNKHAGVICQGAFIHVTHRQAYRSMLTGIAVLREVYALYPDRFEWLQPPYEYEYELMPIDILVGNGWLRGAIERYDPLISIQDRLDVEARTFEPKRQDVVLYS
jgi:uncharacterized protein YbbC (DUF1343 family)